MVNADKRKVVDWIWRLCNIAFETALVLEDWRSVVIFHCTRAKGREMNVRIIEVLAC